MAVCTAPAAIAAAGDNAAPTTGSRGEFGRGSCVRTVAAEAAEDAAAELAAAGDRLADGRAFETSAVVMSGSKVVGWGTRGRFAGRVLEAAAGVTAGAVGIATGKRTGGQRAGDWEKATAASEQMSENSKFCGDGCGTESRYQAIRVWRKSQFGGRYAFC